MPRSLQIALRSFIVNIKRSRFKDVWPIDQRGGNSPVNWAGWPQKKRFALVLTHDVDTAKGQAKCDQLMKLEEESGFLSSFNFVPERYNVRKELRYSLISKGFEVGVHGLNHDGKLYKSKKIFTDRTVRINHYLHEWGAVGFRSPSMHSNLDWIHDLDIEYDASTFDTDPFEPQSEGVGTIFPFWVAYNRTDKGYVELPYTLPQDFTWFILMKENNIDVWKQKLDWIVVNGGMALLNTHPDYMTFTQDKCKIEEYPVEYYVEFLDYIKSRYNSQYWNPLPKEMALFWKENIVTKEHVISHKQLNSVKDLIRPI